MKKIIPSILIVCLCAGGATRGADAGDTRLRETLRNTLIQLRSSETERLTLQNAQVEADQKNKDLATKIEALVKQADKDSKEIAALKAKLSDKDEALLKFKEALAQSQEAHRQAVGVANAKEAERVKLAGDIILLKRHVADQKTKNDALFKTGSEILSRYEKFGLGQAIAAKEPFTGITRVKLENLVQDYEDKLSDGRIAPEPAQKPQSVPDKKPNPPTKGNPSTS